MHRILLLLVLAAGLGSCGTCLLVLSCNVEFRAPDGATYAGVVEYRQPAGLLNLDDSPIGAAIFGLLLEPVDIVLSTVIAVDAMFDAETAVELGPLGYVATLTPFFTLMPLLQLPPPLRIDVDAEQLGSLRGSDAARRGGAIRAAAHDARILDAHLTTGDPLPQPDGTDPTQR